MHVKWLHVARLFSCSASKYLHLSLCLHLQLQLQLCLPVSHSPGTNLGKSYKYTEHSADPNYVSKGLVSSEQITNAIVQLDKGAPRDFVFQQLFGLLHEGTGSTGSGLLCGMSGTYGQNSAGWGFLALEFLFQLPVSPDGRLGVSRPQVPLPAPGE